MGDKVETFYDLASLAKSLITAPLAIEHLDLDKDYLATVGFTGALARSDMRSLTPRQLLSHTSGLPPWLPYNATTSVPVHMQQIDSKQLWGSHKLLRLGIIGTSVYSDLNFRVLGEILEKETGQSYQSLAASKYLIHQPWKLEDGHYPPHAPPDGPDNDTWALASLDGLESYPPRDATLPHDANSRAGMKAHAGFGANRTQFTRCLEDWVRGGWAARQAVPQSANEEGKVWGLGLWRVYAGRGRHGDVLRQLEDRRGDLMIEGKVTVVESDSRAMVGEVAPRYVSLPSPLSTLLLLLVFPMIVIITMIIILTQPSLYFKLSQPYMSTTDLYSAELGEETDWWMHTGFTGPIVFYNSVHKCCIAVLIHRVGDKGQLCTLEERTGRHYHLLNQLLE